MVAEKIENLARKITDSIDRYVGCKKEYCLADYDEEHLEKARIFLKKFILGAVRGIVDRQVDEIMEKFMVTEFREMDSIYINFDMNFIGTDILAAIGISQNEDDSDNSRPQGL